MRRSISRCNQQSDCSRECRDETIQNETMQYNCTELSRRRMQSMVVLLTTTYSYRLSRSMVCLYLPFQAVLAVSFSLMMCLLSGLLCSCFLPSSVFLIHDVCTSFHASVQVNRNLVLWLVSRETITVDGSLHVG